MPKSSATTSTTNIVISPEELLLVDTLIPSLKFDVSVPVDVMEMSPVAPKTSIASPPMNPPFDKNPTNDSLITSTTEIMVSPPRRLVTSIPWLYPEIVPVDVIDILPDELLNISMPVSPSEVTSATTIFVLPIPELLISIPSAPPVLIIAPVDVMLILFPLLSISIVSPEELNSPSFVIFTLPVETILMALLRSVLETCVAGFRTFTVRL